MELIGRRAELSELLGAFDRATTGHAVTVLVGGDAGIGKTRLINELTATVRDRGGTVLTGQCAELGDTIPYLPLTDALWTASRDPRTAPVLHTALHDRPVLARLLPDGEAGADGPAELARQRLFGAVLGLLGELADDRPVLVVLEDLHWADRSTRDLLVFLSRVLEHERVCLVGTYRSDDLHRRHPLRLVVAELTRLPEVTSVEVRPFGPAETADYTTALAGAPLPADVVARVHERSEGNPFYAAELLAAANAGDELPAVLTDLLLSRIEQLPEPAQRVVRAAAVAGRRVDDTLVRTVSGLDEAECERALREIVSHRLLVPDGPGGYTFRHALLREAVYTDLLPGERTRLHAAFARLLAAAPPGGRSRAAAELAHHSLAAHDLATAFAASVTAGREADRLGAPAEACEHYDRALSLWDAVGDPEAAAGLDRSRLALRAVAALAHGGDPHRAVGRLRRLLNDADPADLPLRAELGERLAYHLADLSAEAEARATARTAVDLLPADPPTPQRARALSTYARTLLWSDQHDEVPRWAEEAIAAARATGAGDAEAGARVSLAIHRESHTGAEPATAFAAAVALAREAGDPQIALRAAFHHARTAFDRGDLPGATKAAEEGVRLVLDGGLGQSTYGMFLRLLRYLIHYTSGEWDRTAELAAGFGTRPRTRAEATESAYALFLEVARGAGTVTERLHRLAAFRPADAFNVYIAHGLAAEHALWEGAVDAAIEHVTTALDALEPYDPGILRIAATGLWAQADRAAGARSAGDDATALEAVRAADDLVRRARETAADAAAGIPRGWLGVEGVAWLARAEAEWHRARGDDGPDLWRAVVDAFDYGFDYEVARSRLRLAESLAAHGDRAAATAEWRRALETAERLGAAPLARALDRLGRRARLGGGGRPGAGPAGLTGREREVLRLVAAGRNNREIAAALVISPKTASVHVSNILGKLGAASRTQAAAIAHREGLVDG
ncbi:LuxR family transcriptional regulator [Actinomadura craniellae]|uniref:LuxR family transcriptional regulator n=1 Tax=Actinomadura craniellae TaxID=2231787 RepID=A0A365HC08_9ACTN|nr:helix-turn-helix transcriptional regulator [Actinomadura craniellae]RAY16627.1 LuxR family transcriptional regulator [Actinomadura craniellae]